MMSNLRWFVELVVDFMVFLVQVAFVSFAFMAGIAAGFKLVQMVLP